MNTYPYLTCFAISKFLANACIGIWEVVKCCLTLLNGKSIVKKMKAKQIR